MTDTRKRRAFVLLLFSVPQTCAVAAVSFLRARISRVSIKFSAGGACSWERWDQRVEGEGGKLLAVPIDGWDRCVACKILLTACLLTGLLTGIC